MDCKKIRGGASHVSEKEIKVKQQGMNGAARRSG